MKSTRFYSDRQEKQICGIYKILNIINNKFYIGSSVNIYNRWKGHISALDKNCHNNKKLQNAWNKYGKYNFKFIILQEVEPSILRQVENDYIKNSHCFDDKIGYNILDDTNIGLGVSASPEIRKKISLACSGSRNGNYGNYHSSLSKQIISLKAKIRAKENHIKKLQLWLDGNFKCEYCGKIMYEQYASGRFCNRICQSSYQSKITKGRKKPSDFGMKVSKSLKNKPKSEQTKKKISENAKRRMKDPKNNPMYGRKHSKETKLKISKIIKSLHINSKRFKGHKHTDRTKAQISQSLHNYYNRSKKSNE